MGAKCAKEIKVIQAATVGSKVDFNDSRSSKSIQLEANKGTNQKNNEHKISIPLDITSTVPINTGVRKSSKKIKPMNDMMGRSESQNLKVIKPNNKELDDSKLIDKCLTQLFFMKSLDRTFR